ncbi:MAG: BMP family ABC transporter substrate-binding protein [Actinomycetia bacterium]|nr:BMP family ABC transporter substrate-binding protein [Actinomycetes bacterium]
MKLMGLLLALTMIAAACGDSDESGDTTAAPEETTATTEAGPTSDTNVGLTFDIGGRGDQSFNDSAATGIDKAQNELGISFTEAEPNADGSNRSELLQTQADVSQLVIAVGFLFGGDVEAVAAENAGVNFAVIDDAMLDFDNGGVPRGDNIAGLTFAEHEGSFLVGVAAALKSETGTVGFIGGVSGFGLIERFEAGFNEGARAVNPDIEIIPQYITEFPNFDGFNAPDRAKDIALGMYDQGADIVYHAAGGSGAGMFEAAKEQSEATGSKVWGIGVDSDQYNTVSTSVQEYVMTSMLKRVDVAVFEITKAHEDGMFAAGNTVYDLSVDGVGYSTTGGFIDDIVDQIEDYKAKIVSGEIVVPTEP